jgi:hypothetical protein
MVEADLLELEARRKGGTEALRLAATAEGMHA